MGMIFLTKRQHQILEGLVEGLTHKEIAVRYGLGLSCIAIHVMALKKKLGAINPVQIGIHAIALGLINCPDKTEVMGRIKYGNQN